MVNLTNYPVIVNSGVVKNTFAGFDDVNIDFQRKDLEIETISQGSDNNILIKVLGDITGELNVGEWIYCNSTATTLTYNFSAEVLSVGYSGTNTSIMLGYQYIESSAAGYINYKQNYFLECLLVNPNNNNVRIIEKSVNADGNAKGEICINVNIPVDLLSQNFDFSNGEIVNSRVKFAVKYRENYRDNTDNAYTTIDDYPIILIYATENCEAEKVANAFNEPKFWVGYPNALLLAHSDANAGGERVDVKFSELDINKKVLVPPFSLDTFNLADYGLLQVSTVALGETYVLDEDSQYGKLVFETVGVADYDSDDYLAGDYVTT